MDLSNEDILELINRLLERLHQTGEDKESSHITLCRPRRAVCQAHRYANLWSRQIAETKTCQFINQ